VSRDALHAKYQARHAVLLEGLSPDLELHHPSTASVVTSIADSPTPPLIYRLVEADDGTDLQGLAIKA
jgi:hypothetical protein